ncbi:TetR/AcrR family transcriptional regulator [Shewanella litorisediminis]|uniref:WHG domain-containing protein n=1 Tax=Shewanella litorisediminis TaxID=1173586 RepID=A0ABX7G442_9GAMM|nr:TetR-like C-terminal domain-containing protein [Shewanella litorisediminis]MCL2919359.1 WHG domain-containing protein [Shewanella litorisediminis]QRH02023.1 WHG domain-containing protein [Shewanella litorisediminis]
MARRKEHSHEQIREMAINEVERWLEAEPLQDLSLRKVAQRIGYAPSTLVKVFGSYPCLLLAVAGRSLEVLDNIFARHLANSQSHNVQGSKPHLDASQAKAALNAMAQSYGQFALSSPGRFSLVFELKLPAEAPLPSEHCALIESLLHRPESCLSAMFPSLGASQLRYQTRLLWAALHGLVALSLQDKLFLLEHSLAELLTVQLGNQLHAISVLDALHTEVKP